MIGSGCGTHLFFLQYEVEPGPISCFLTCERADIARASNQIVSKPTKSMITMYAVACHSNKYGG